MARMLWRPEKYHPVRLALFGIRSVVLPEYKSLEQFCAQTWVASANVGVSVESRSNGPASGTNASNGGLKSVSGPGVVVNGGGRDAQSARRSSHEAPPLRPITQVWLPDCERRTWNENGVLSLHRAVAQRGSRSA